ncbi:hypothetical protein [Hallella mizrahii]|uniref:Fimbrillin family protein n=1 Tax=Hallella mizrahii TaxID=2606637 RepID=A0A7K0KGK7_9BACT|nr:hypothetical protein [Hallella mizrahii]MST85056.1 hypothetical protein [Hallella mizrahii]
MQHTLIAHGRKVMTALFALVLVLAFASCRDSDDEDDSHAVTVVFTLSVNDAVKTTAAKSRATAPPEGTGTWQNYDPQGDADDYENGIDFNKIFVYFYNVGGNYVGQVKDMSVYQDASQSNVYHIVGKMDISKDEIVDDQFTGHMVVYVNMEQPSTTAAWTDDAVHNITYSYDPNNPTYIPMWGVKKVSFSTTAGTQQNLDEVSMLRAMAKVSVQLDTDIMKGWTIRSISIDRWNNKGYCLPGVISGLDNTKDLTFNNSLHVFTGSGEATAIKATPIDFTATATTASTASKNLYLPEYDNTSAGVTPATLSVTLTDPDGKKDGPYKLKFVQYDGSDAPTGAPYDIVRNHWYQYIIYKNAERTLTVKLTVRKWNREDHPEIVM